MRKSSSGKCSDRQCNDDSSALSSNDMESRTENRSDNADLEDTADDDEKFDASLIKQEDLTLKNCNKYLNAVTDTVTVTVSPTMLLLTLPNTIPKNDGDGAIQANILDFNHNDPTKVKGYEIMNTMMDNVFQTIYNLFKDIGWGPDGEVLFVNIDVSSCPSSIQNANFTS